VQGCEAPKSCSSGLCSSCSSSSSPVCSVPASPDFPEPYFNVSFPAQCGEDLEQCGGKCGPLNGRCPLGQVCQLRARICVTLLPCDTYVPSCDTSQLPSSTKQYFCNNLCHWQELNDPLPDIVPTNEEDVSPSILMHWRDFDTTSCAIGEGCVFQKGSRLLFRFDTNVINMGTADYIAPSPFDRPDLLIYAECHQHYHEDGFAFYYLTFPDNNTVALQSLKRSYCVVTSGVYQTGPKNPCSSNGTCDSQKLEPGNFDSYTSDLDCQWLVRKNYGIVFADVLFFRK
jgi:hypothetical protein